MKIVTIPHPALRQKANKVTDFSSGLKKFLADLQQTLQKTDNPRGVGLAAPQVDTSLRIFATQIDEDRKQLPQIFINPLIVKQSDKHTFGPDPEEPRLEGCLSMPL